ncbi:hypothetical protein EGW08_021973, partial [Elysia chlorotica]
MTRLRRGLRYLAAAVALSVFLLYALVLDFGQVDLKMALSKLDLSVGLFESHEAWCLRGLDGCGETFGPERGSYNFTVVTGFLDIGRGSWWKQGRTYREYLTYMLKVLKLDVNLVVFIEPKGENFVRVNRRGREKRTVIHPITLEDLELFPLLPKIEEVMYTKEFQQGNSNFQHGNCEAFYPLYNLVTNSKVDLIHQVVRENPFNSSYFIWMDGGFGHGETEECCIFPSDGIWNPTHLMNFPDYSTETSFIDQLTVSRPPPCFFFSGLFGGGSDALSIYHQLHTRTFLDYLARGIVDDDQTIFLGAFLSNRTNFRPIRGGWYDLMK